MPRPPDPRAKMELLRAAEAVFAENGLTAAKVEDITARAGVSKGAFYLHFATKEECFEQIVEGFLAKLASRIHEAPSAEKVETMEDWSAEARAWYRHDVEVFEFVWQNRGLMGLLFTGGGSSPYRYLMDAFAERVTKQIDVWVRHLIDVGVYRADLDPEILPPLLTGGYERLMREMMKRTKRPDIAGWVRQAMNVYMRGLLTSEARVVFDREVSSPSPV